MKNKPDATFKVIIWIVWGAFFYSLFMYRAFLSPADQPAADGTGLLAILFLAIPVAGAIALRWQVLPRLKNLSAILLVVILGSALGEMLIFFGLFLFPEHVDLFFAASVLMIAQFIPIYLHQKTRDQSRLNT